MVDDPTPDSAESATATPRAGRPLRTWAILLLVWAVGLIVWVIYLAAILYLLFKLL